MFSATTLRLADWRAAIYVEFPVFNVQKIELPARLATLGDDPANHERIRLDAVAAPSRERSFPQMELMAVAPLEARACHFRPVPAERGVHAGIVVVFHDPHVQRDWSSVRNRPCPGRRPGLCAEICAADQLRWDVLQLVVPLTRIYQKPLRNCRRRIPANAQSR